MWQNYAASNTAAAEAANAGDNQNNYINFNQFIAQHNLGSPSISNAPASMTANSNSAAATVSASADNSNNFPNQHLKNGAIAKNSNNSMFEDAVEMQQNGFVNSKQINGKNSQNVSLHIEIH